jgi:hypothetical protein
VPDAVPCVDDVLDLRLEIVRADELASHLSCSYWHTFFFLPGVSPASQIQSSPYAHPAAHPIHCFSDLNTDWISMMELRQLRYVAAVADELYSSADLAEGINAFRERRKATFGRAEGL